MKFVAVTTWAAADWELYARRCIETFEAHWRDVDLIRFDDPELEASSSWLAAFKQRHRHRSTMDYRFDAVRFAHKVAAIELASASTDAEALIWTDADCVTHDDVTPDWLETLLGDGDFAYLRRTDKYPECGFMMFRRNSAGLEFLKAIVLQYSTDALFELAEWHDSFVIDAVRSEREASGLLKSVSLSGVAEGTAHPLINGPLGAKLDHLKGPRKQLGKSRARDLKVKRTEPYWTEVK